MSKPFSLKRAWPIYLSILAAGFAGSLSGYLKASLNLGLAASSIIYIIFFLPAILVSLGAIWLQERIQHK